MGNFLRIHPLLWVLWLLTTVAAIGQPRPDILISPPDQGYRMIESARIQMADSANGTIAVVWGTTEQAKDGTMAVALYVQAIRNGSPTGKPQKLGRQDSHILGRPRIAAMGSGFIILYYDKPNTDVAGVYTQFYDATIGILHQSYWIGNRDFTASDIAHERIYTFKNDSSWTLFWYDYNARGYYSAPRLYSSRIDTLGKPLQPTSDAGGYLSQLLYYTDLSDFVLLTDITAPTKPNWQAVIWYPATFQYDTRKSPLLNAPFYISSDTSVLLLRDSVVLYYPSLFDTASTSRTLPLSTWGGGKTQSNYQQFPVSLITKSNGKITVYLLIGKSGVNKAPVKKAYCMVVRLQMDNINSPITTDTLFTITDTTTGSEKFQIKKYHYAVGCDNQWNVSIDLGVEGGNTQTQLFFMLNRQGDLLPTNALPTINCLLSPTITPIRMPVDSASIVSVLADTITLQVPTIRRKVPNHYRPTITAFPTTLVCSWRQSDTLNPDISRKWFAYSDSLSNPKGFDRIIHASKGINNPDVISSFVSDNIIPSINSGLLQYNNRDYIFVSGTTLSGQPYRSPKLYSFYLIGRLGENGWEVVENVVHTGGDRYEPPFLDHFLNGAVLGYNPDNQEIIVRVNGSSHEFSGIALWGYRTDRSKWELRNPPLLTDTSMMTPIGVKSYVVVHNNKLFRVYSGKVDSLPISNEGYRNTRLQKLYGPYFARTAWSALDSTKFIIETFDTLGQRIDSASFNRPAATNDYQLVQNPKNHNMALIFGSQNGVQGIYVNHKLQMISNNLRLSKTTNPVKSPAGAFRNDTLYVLWEESRDTMTRIYGNYASLIKRLDTTVVLDSATTGNIGDDRKDTAAHPAMHDSINSIIFPNPVHDRLLISTTINNQQLLSAEVWNPLGELVHRTELKDILLPSQISLDLRSLPVGVYLMRLQCQHGDTVITLLKE